MLDLEKLVLVPGKVVYTVFVDCSVLNTDGNLLDATSYAVVSALLSSKLPVFEMQDGKVVDTGKLQDAPLTTIPVSITAVRIGDTILSDPTAEEEACMNARITITTNSNSEYAAIQKGFAGGFTRDQIKKAAEVARIKGERVRARLQELTKKAG
jgi:exosome complex component RRP42